MELEIAVLSRTGGRSVNEDACGFWPGPGICYCVLADGAGGHGGGDVASKLVVETALNAFRERQGCSADVVAGAMHRANEALVVQQRSHRKLAEMRATVVVLALDFEHAQAWWGHVGDSRLYCFRGREIVAQTRDHSVVQTMVEAGYLKPHELRTSPERSKLLSALGDREGFEPSVEAQAFQLKGEDKFLMCSDGLWEYIEDDELAQTVTEASSAEEWLRSLESRVLSLARPGHDNYSALAVWCKP